MANSLEVVVKNYIKEKTKDTVDLRIPLAKIAEDIDSSTASVWRAIKKLEDRRIIKVIKPRIKTEPNVIYYLGEENEIDNLVDDLMVKTASLLIIMKEIKKRIKQRDDKTFALEREVDRLNKMIGS